MWTADVRSPTFAVRCNGAAGATVLPVQRRCRCKRRCRCSRAAGATVLPVQRRYSGATALPVQRRYSGATALPVLPSYSSRSACTGSMREARRAGI